MSVRNSDLSRLVRKCSAYIGVTAVYFRRYCPDAYNALLNGSTFDDVMPVLNAYKSGVRNNVVADSVYKVMSEACAYTKLTRLQLSCCIYSAYAAIACGATFDDVRPLLDDYNRKLAFIRKHSAADLWAAIRNNTL